MIKICSLDFLNRENFETDVITADGVVLFQSGEEITPSKLLRLYFKEIYITQPLAAKEQVVNKVVAGILADATVETSIPETAIEDEYTYETNNFVVPEADFSKKPREKKKSKKGQKAASSDADVEDETKKDSKSADIDIDLEEVGEDVND